MQDLFSTIEYSTDFALIVNLYGMAKSFI